MDKLTEIKESLARDGQVLIANEKYAIWAAENASVIRELMPLMAYGAINNSTLQDTLLESKGIAKAGKHLENLIRMGINIQINKNKSK